MNRSKMTLMYAVIATLILFISPHALATTVSLSGTLGGVDSNNIRDDGVGNYDYAIDRTAANTYYWSAGSPVIITGTVDVRGLTSGSYLQIGLVDKNVAYYSLDYYGSPGSMFNNSAFVTFYAGTSNYARLADDNFLYSGKLNNPGSTIGVFNFTLDIASDGTMGLTLLGSSDVSTTYTYGSYNWDEYYPGTPWADFLGPELAHGSYLIAQLWIDTGNTTNRVSAAYDITGINSVPEPTSIILLGLGLVALGGFKRKLLNQPEIHRHH